MPALTCSIQNRSWGKHQWALVPIKLWNFVSTTNHPFNATVHVVLQVTNIWSWKLLSQSNFLKVTAPVTKFLKKPPLPVGTIFTHTAVWWYLMYSLHTSNDSKLQDNRESGPLPKVLLPTVPQNESIQFFNELCQRNILDDTVKRFLVYSLKNIIFLFHHVSELCAVLLPYVCHVREGLFERGCIYLMLLKILGNNF